MTEQEAEARRPKVPLFESGRSDLSAQADEQEAEAQCTCRRYGRPEPTCVVHSVPQEAGWNDAHARWKIVADALAATERDLEDQRTKRRAAEQERDAEAKLAARLRRLHYEAEARERDLREALEDIRDNIGSLSEMRQRAQGALQATQEDQ